MSDTPNNPLLPAERQTLLDAALANKDRPNGITDDQIRRLFAVAGRRRADPDYVKRLFDGAEEARKRINEEYLREMDAEENK